MSGSLVTSAITAATAAALLCGCQGLTGVPAAPQESAHQRRVDLPARGAVIGVLFAGWHTGLILPVDELGPLRSRLPGYAAERYVSFGWGNRRFYMARRPSIFDALAALFPSASTMLVAGAPRVHDLLPEGATYRWICVDRREVSRIDRYLLQSLRIRNGKALVLGPGPTPESAFVASRQHYDAFDTCNTWTATALEQAGIPLEPFGVLFSHQLRLRLRDVPACRLSGRTARSDSPVRAPAG